MTTGIVIWFYGGLALAGLLFSVYILSTLSPGFKRWFEKYFWGSGS